MIISRNYCDYLTDQGFFYYRNKIKIINKSSFTEVRKKIENVF